MNRSPDAITAEAAAWHLASMNGNMDWDGFTVWLEADPRHRAAYDEVSLADLRLAELASGIELPPLAANDAGEEDEPVRRSNGWRWAGGAIAASLALALAVPQFIAAGPQVYATQGSSRDIALSDGSSIQLAPHSHLEVSDREERIALNGGAYFDIRHDPSRQLVVEAGGLQIRDIGTQFDVQDAAGQVRVAVSEGKVSVNSGALTKPIALDRGRRLTFNPAGGQALVENIQAEDAGAWRTGRLTYQGAPLALVAADLSRYSEMKVTVAQPLQDREFSGTLIVNDGQAALRDLTQLLGLSVADDGGTYRIVPAER